MLLLSFHKFDHADMDILFDLACTYHVFCLVRLMADQIRELLSFYKFDGDNIPLVAGSALAAVEGRDKEVGEDAIMELMKAVDEHIPTPTRCVCCRLVSAPQLLLLLRLLQFS